MTRLIPPPGPSYPSEPAVNYQPVEDTGDFVLSDASGIISAWSIVDGVLEVTTTALAGTAYILRPIAVPPKPLTMSIINVRARRVVQSLQRLPMCWGVGGDPTVDPLEFNAVGISLEPSSVTDRAVAYSQGVVGFSETTLKDTYCKGVITTGAPSGNTATTQSAMASGGIRFGGTAESATHRTTTGSPTFPLTTEGWVISRSGTTIQTASAEFAVAVQSQDYTTP